MALKSWSKDINLGSLTKNGYTQTAYLRITVTEKEQDIPNNKTKVQAKAVFDLTPDSHSYSWAATNRSASLSGDLTDSYTLNNASSTYWYRDSNYTLIDETDWIKHNNDGSKTISLSFSFSSTYGYSGSGSWNFTLTSIPRASDVTVTDATLGGTPVLITCSRAVNDFTHIVKIQDPDNNAIKETFSNVGANHQWSPSLATYASCIPTASKQFNVICETYKNSTQTSANLIGTKTSTVILTIARDDTTKPTISSNQVAITELNTSIIPNGWGVYVQSKSRLRFTLTPTLYTGATAGAGGILFDGTSTISPNTTNTTIQIDWNKVVQGYGSMTIKGNVRDSRNFKFIDTTDPNSWENLGTIDIKKYAMPSFNATPIMSRVNANNVADVRGEYLAFSMDARASAVTKTGTTRLNSPVFKIKIREKGSSGSWTERTYSGTYNSTTDDYEFIKSNEPFKDSSNNKIHISATTAYDVVFEITDAFTSSGNVTKTTSINVGADLLHFNKNGHAIGIGQLSTAGDNEEKLEVGYDTTVGTSAENKTLRVYGSIIATGIVKSNYKFRLSSDTTNIDLFWFEEV